MSILGDWINSLTDEERDRIVEAQEWEVQGSFSGEPPFCLVQHAKPGQEGAAINVPRHCLDVANRFDRLCTRFGLPRIVKACKQRAGHASPVPQMSGRAERTGPGSWPVTVNPGRGA